MKGVITKKHALLVWREFGFRKAIALLLSKEPVALITLIS